MAATTVLEMDSVPAVVPTYLRALTSGGSGLADGETIPRIESRIDGVKVSRRALAGYCEVCGFAAGNELPLTYPHVLAFPVHMAVMTHKRFPLKLMGLVHVRNRITRHRSLAVSETLDLRVRVGGHRDVHNGVEFDLVTTFFDREGECVWDSTSTMLSRGKGSGKRSGRKKRAPEDEASYPQQANWGVPADIGRRYARHAGDINPIHLSALSAKLFGFPCAIAHGMWLKARTAAQLQPELAQDACSMEVAFKRPVLLPTSVALQYDSTETGIDFALTNQSGSVRHMTGAITYDGHGA